MELGVPEDCQNRALLCGFADQDHSRKSAESEPAKSVL